MATRILISDSDNMVAPAEARSIDPAVLRGALAEAAQTTRMFLAFFLLGFVVVWVLSVGLVIHLRANRAAAHQGNELAARKIILPAFEPLLLVLALFNTLFILLLSIALATGIYARFVPPIVLEALYSAHQFDFLTVLVFMLQHSVSIPALRRTFAISLVLSGYTIPYIWIVMTYGDPKKQTVYVNWLHPLRALVLLLSIYVFIWPPSRASTRTLRELAVYNVMRYVLTTVHMVMLLNSATRENAKYTLFVTLFATALNPLVIWRVLKADTSYWRGMGDRACALQGLFKQNHHMHEGVSSQGLHVLIELHRKHILDFALLDLRQQIGVGTTSTVFRGLLRAKTRVAVKVYQPTSFTDDVVAGFSHEAALCGLLHHPNIVTFYGMCVSPPAICLVFELCQGSLQDVTRVYAHRAYDPARQQLLINVGYMLDAARAVAYIHSFSPPFIHRDIKPENFLVDVDCNVKLADFGESRALELLIDAEASAATTATTTQRPTLTTIARASGARATGAHGNNKSGRARKTRRPSVTNDAFDVLDASSPDFIRDEEWSATNMTVKGTADYMAPEVINGRAGVARYDQAADVYSLAITMWDILNPHADRFGQQSYLYVFESVLRGARPLLSTSLPLRLRNVIERAWDGDARLRPSATAIVAVLEEVQESLSATVVVDVIDELQLGPRQPDNSLSTGSSASAAASGNCAFSGVAIADALIETKFVNSTAEAARMGNAWMDAGLLHHSAHARAFEVSTTAHYYVDASASAKLRQAIEAAACHVDPSSTNTIPILPLSVKSHIHHLQHHQHVPRPPPPQQQQQHTHHFLHYPARGSSVSLASIALRVDDCACQRFARRLVDQTSWHRFRRKPATAHRTTTPDDMVLTTALLMDSDDDFGSFSNTHGRLAARASRL